MYTFYMKRIITLMLFSILAYTPCAAETLPGPITAKVTRIIDGDTFDVRAQIWVGHYIETRVRLTGLDTPEIRGKCDSERQQARAAQDRLKHLIADKEIILENIENGKYAGRVLAAARTSGGLDIKDTLIAEGFARAYDGGKRLGWCDVTDYSDETAMISP